MIRDRESETEVKKIQWPFNRLPRVLYMTETIGSKYKWNPGFLTCLKIPHSVPHINRRLQIISLCDLSDICCLGKSSISGTQMSLEIVTETGGFQKDFDIPCLAVADDKKRIFFPKFLQGMFQALIEMSTFF